ncbi:MAG: hypothetical protein ACOH5I_01795 [Oligoflexus sp.]
MSNLFKWMVLVLVLTSCFFQDHAEHEYYDDRAVHWMSCSYYQAADQAQYFEIDLIFVKGIECRDNDLDLLTKRKHVKNYFKDLQEFQSVNASYSPDGLEVIYLQNRDCVDELSRCVLRDDSNNIVLSLNFDEAQQELLVHDLSQQIYPLECREMPIYDEYSIPTCDLVIPLDELTLQQEKARAEIYDGRCFKEELMQTVEYHSYPYRGAYQNLEEFVAGCLERPDARYDEQEQMCYFEQIKEEWKLTEIFEFFASSSEEISQVCDLHTAVSREELQSIDVSQDEAEHSLGYYQSRFELKKGQIVHSDLNQDGYYIHWTRLR